ncbi:MAG: O-antigen ligase family protein, partial [Gammaproteobacteria bacterium]
RFVLWEFAFKKYTESPVFGIGFHSFHHVNPYEGRDTHNYFIKVLTEQGAVGLVILLMIFWRSLVASRSLFDRTSDPLFKALGLGMLGCIMAFMIGNIFGDRFSHYPLVTYFWVYLALVLRALLLCEAAEKLAKTNAASV